MFAEVVEEAGGFLGRGRFDEAGAFAFARVRKQGKLGDGEDGPADVPDATVHLSLVVGHDSQSRYLFGEPVGFGLAVPVRHADQQEETGPYAGHRLPGDRYGGFCDALEDYTQGR